MLAELIRHNLLASVNTFRFLITFLMIVGLFAAAALVSSSQIDRAEADYRDQEIQQHRLLESSSNHLIAVASLRQEIAVPPALLAFILSGSHDQLPNVASVSAFSLFGTENVSRVNPLLPNRHVLDWSFIIGVVLSFVALVLTFDGVSGEKENATLRQVLSESVPRSVLVFAKIIAGDIILLLPLAVGMLTGYSILSIGHPQLLRLPIIAQLTLVFILSIVYVSMFVVLGSLVSSLTRRPAVSLVVCLMIWVSAVLIVPNLGTLIGQMFSPIPSAKDVEAKISLGLEDVYKNAPGDVWSCFSPDLRQPCYQMRAEMHRKELDTEAKIRSGYRSEQLRQLQTAIAWTQLSPTVLYEDAVAGIADVGVHRCIDFLQQVERYRSHLHDFIVAEDARDTSSIHLLDPYENTLMRLATSSPVKYRDVPQFSYTTPAVPALATENAPRMLILLAWNCLLMAATVVAFNRYDAR